MVLCRGRAVRHDGYQAPGHGFRAASVHADVCSGTRTRAGVAAPDGTVQYVSGGVRNSLGYTSEERQSNNLFEHVHPDDREALRAKYQQLVDGEIKSYSCEFRVRHKDGSYPCVE